MPQPEIAAVHPFNHPAAVFRALAGAWQQDAAGARVDVLAAELAACAARSDGPLCLALLQPDAAPKLYGLGTFLDGCGITLSQRSRQQGDGVFVFMARKALRAHEFAGATVTERVSVRRAPQHLARAA